MIKYIPTDPNTQQLSPSLINQTERDYFQEQLLSLLAKIMQRYTGNESSSVPQTIVQELLCSIYYTLGLTGVSRPSTIRTLLKWGLDKSYDKGLKLLRVKTELAKKVWQTACITTPPLTTSSYENTLQSLNNFGRHYDYHFFAHHIPGDIDYQLCHPITEELMGVDYLIVYLQRIVIENQFLHQFAPNDLSRLFHNYLPDYQELVTNLYEPVATNAIGLTLIGKSPDQLSISDADRQQIFLMIKPMTQKELTKSLQQAAHKLAFITRQSSPQSDSYLLRLAADIVPRLSASLDAGNIEKVFIGERK